MSNPQVPPTPTLAEAQAFMKAFVEERIQKGDFQPVTGPDLCMLLAEEVGETAKEVRRLHFNEKKTPETRKELSHELVDILNYICRIANTYGLDLQTAYLEKNRILTERFPS